jgi:hypothetical protein
VKVLVLVLSVDREPWRSIERDGQRATWAARYGPDDSAPVFFYRGKLDGPTRFVVASITRILSLVGSDRGGSFASSMRVRFLRLAGRLCCRSRSTTVGDVIQTDVPETYAMVTTKLFATLTHVLATEQFDYLFRTNTSTYVDRRRLVEFAEGLPRSGFWGGFLGSSDGITFTSGAGTLMSRDCVVKAINADWDWSVIDDVALGGVMQALEISPEPIKRPVLESTEEATNADLDAFMWRCKGVDERNDVSIMIALHDALQSQR